LYAAHELGQKEEPKEAASTKRTKQSQLSTRPDPTRPDRTGPEVTLFRDHSISSFFSFVAPNPSRVGNLTSQPSERERPRRALLAEEVRGGSPETRSAGDIPRACRERRRRDGACSDRLGGRTQSSGRASGSGEEKASGNNCARDQPRRGEAWPRAPDKKAARGRGRRHHAASRSGSRPLPGSARQCRRGRDKSSRGLCLRRLLAARLLPIRPSAPFSLRHEERGRGREEPRCSLRRWHAGAGRLFPQRWSALCSAPFASRSRRFSSCRLY
jgi:hypothetical protein